MKEFKRIFILTKFRGVSSNFRFDNFQIVDFHSTLSWPGRVKIYDVKAVKRKWLEAPLNFVKIKRTFLDSFKLNPRLGRVQL